MTQMMLASPLLCWCCATLVLVLALCCCCATLVLVLALCCCWCGADEVIGAGVMVRDEDETVSVGFVEWVE